MSTFANGEIGSSVRAKINTVLAQEFNVKDPAFGAVGNGIADDTAAIQAAVNAAVAAGGADQGGRVYCPPGNYLVTSPITFNGGAIQTLIFTGCGVASLIQGNFAGYILDRNSTVSLNTEGVVIESLHIKNVNAGGGGIRLRGMVNSQVRSCRVQANIGIVLSGVSPNDVGFDSSVFNCEVNGLASNPASGSIGIMLGPETSAWGCGIVNFDNGIRCYGAGVTIGACRIEVNNVGIMVGRDLAGSSFSVSAGKIFGTTLEGNLEAIYINSAAGLSIDGVEASFGSNAPPGNGSSINGFHFWSGNNIVISASKFSGSFTNAGIYFEGNPDANSPAVTFVSVNTDGFVAGGGVALGSCEQINCSGIPTFAVPFASLPSYLPEGSRRAITNCSINTFGSVADGAGSFHVPVHKDNVGWKVG